MLRRLSKKPVAIILCGVPGSGKTKFRNEILSLIGHVGAAVISTDDYLDTIRAMKDCSYGAAFYHAKTDGSLNAWLNSIATLAYQSRASVIWDQTNLTVKSRKRALTRFPAESWTRIAVAFGPGDIPDFLRDENGLKRYDEMSRAWTFPTVEEGFDRVVQPAEFFQELLHLASFTTQAA